MKLTIKQQVLSGLAILLISFCACKKADTPPTIVGKWIKVKVVLFQTTTGQQSINDITTNSDQNIYVQFNSDGSGVISAKSGNTYATSLFKYVLINSSLTVTSGSTTEVDNVTTLTSSNLVIHSESSYTTGNVITKMVVDTYYNK